MCPRDDEENPKRPNCYAKRKRAHERTSARTMKMNAGTTQTQTSARTCTPIHSFIHVPARWRRESKKAKIIKLLRKTKTSTLQLTTPGGKERFQFGQTNGHSDDGAPLPAEGLPVGVFPLPRSKFTWGKKSKGAGATRPKASIRYFPVRLTKARTVHKAQGARIPTLLIGGNENFYTAISRGVKLDDIYLLKDVTQATLKACQPSAEKAAALAHHAKIADETARLLDPDRT